MMGTLACECWACCNAAAEAVCLQHLAGQLSSPEPGLRAQDMEDELACYNKGHLLDKKSIQLHA